MPVYSYRKEILRKTTECNETPASELDPRNGFACDSTGDPEYSKPIGYGLRVSSNDGVSAGSSPYSELLEVRRSVKRKKRLSP